MKKNCLNMCGCVSSRKTRFRNSARSACGFTLIELMIVVAIVAILSAIAYPSYQNYIREARRTDAKEALLRLQIEQEKWRTNHATYSGEPAGTNCGSTAATGLCLSSSSAEGYYTIAITSGSASATGYTATATAVSGKSQASDSGCTTLTLAIAAGGETKNPAGCW